MTLRFTDRIIVALVSHLALFCAMILNSSAQLFPTLTAYDSGGGQALAMAVGDFNGDGIPDVAVINACPGVKVCNEIGMVGVLLGNHDGTLQPAQTYSSEGIASISIAAGDINGDSKLDLAVANFNAGGQGSVSILLGNGDGTFQPAISYAVGGFATFVALTDLNGDGLDDLVVSTNNYNPTSGLPTVTVFLAHVNDPANGLLQFSNNYNVAGGLQEFGSISVTDMNADGKPDLLVTNRCIELCFDNSNVTVLFGNGDGTFSDNSLFLQSGGAASSVGAADLNQDGLQDLVVSNGCRTTDVGCESPHNVEVLLADASGGFQQAKPYASLTPYPPNHVVIGDVNRDGIPDLVTANGAVARAGVAEVFLGNGDGSFQPPTDYATGGRYSTFVAISDINQDSKPDLLILDTSALPSDDPNATIHGIVNVLLGTVVARTVSTLTSAPAHPMYGQSVTLTSAVTSVASGTPVGTVTFLDGTSSIGTATLASGQASLIIPSLALGIHSLAVSYAGDASFSGSVSAPVEATVSKAATQILLASSLNPSLVGQSATFTATIVPASGTGPNGTVSFFDGTKPLGSAAVSGGTAVLSTSSLKQATHSITATYSGDGNFTGSTSDVLSQVVEFATTTSLVSSLNPSIFGQQVIFTATVAAAGGTPKGSVTFTANNKSLGNVKVAGGTAILGTSGLKVGSTEIIATYNGSAGFRVSSGAMVQVVNGAATSTAITGSSLNPSTYGDVVTFTAVVSSNGGTPTGNVRFKVGSTLLGPATLSDGVATLTTSAGQLPGGADSIVAIYNGTAQFTGSTSPAFLQTVNQAVSATTLTSSANPASSGQTVTFTATVNGSFAIPAGKVRFRDGTTSLGVVSLSNGVAAYTATALSRKTHNISATYEGNLSYLTSSANLQQVVR